MKQEETYNPSPQNTATQATDSQRADEKKLFSFVNTKRNNAVRLIKQKLLTEFDPVIKRSEKAMQPAKNWMTRHPIPSFMLMIIVILLNATLAIVFSENRLQENNNYTAIIKKITKDLTHDSLLSSPPSSPWLLFDAIADLEAIEQIRDSLDLLLLKKHLTAEDSLAFIRLSERLQKINNR